MQPIKLANNLFGVAAMFALVATTTGETFAGASKMKTLLLLPNGAPDGNAVSDTQGGYFIPWINEDGNAVEILDVRPGKKNKWTLFATSNEFNPRVAGSHTYMAPDGTGGAYIANCDDRGGAIDAIAHVYFLGSNLNASPIFTTADSGNCMWTGIATASPTSFYVSASDGVSFNNVIRLTFTDQWAITSIALPGPPAYDRIFGTISPTELVGMNDRGSNGTGELFAATISGSSASYQTLYALNSKFGSRFYSVAPISGGQYIGTTYQTGGDGVTVDVVQGAKKMLAKKIGSDTGAFEQVSALADGSQFWEVAGADTFGNAAYASRYVANDGKYKLQAKATIAGTFYPLQVIAKADGSADGLLVDENTGLYSLVNFSAGTPVHRQAATHTVASR